VLDGLDRQVDVEIGPVEMLLGWYVNVEKVIDDRAPEPRKLLEWEKELSIAQENPEPVTGDVRHFSFQSAAANAVAVGLEPGPLLSTAA